jgi:predicted deacylase
VRNVLKHAGIMKGELEIGPSVMLDMPDGDCFVFCQDDGMFEAMKNWEILSENGEIVARVWPVDRTGRRLELSRPAFRYSGVAAFSRPDQVRRLPGCDCRQG